MTFASSNPLTPATQSGLCGALSRSWALRTAPLARAGQRPKINAIFKKHSNGRDLSDVPARNFTGFMTLLDAINRAGSTDPEKIRVALATTNIPADQLIVPYRGVKFDATGSSCRP